MARRVSLSKFDRATPHGAALFELCERITKSGKLIEGDIRELIRWLRDNREVRLPAIDFLASSLATMVADRAISRDEQKVLHLAIEKVLPPDIRKKSVQARKRQKLIDDGWSFAPNGREYKIEKLVGRVEYGEDSIIAISARLGAAVAAMVEQQVRARERQLTGHVVRETEGGAWIFRVAERGDYCLPIRATRVLSGTPPGPLTIAVVGSFAAEIDRQQPGRNLVSFSTFEVAERFNVDVDVVRRWIREGYLAASMSGNGSAAFEYRIDEADLMRFTPPFTS